MLRKTSIVTAAAMLSLALAIGACTVAFSLIDTFFLRPLPVRDPSNLVFLLHANHELQSDYDSAFSPESFDHLVEASRGHADLFGYSWANPPITFDDSGGEEERVQVNWISGDGFRILGIRPVIGRVLNAADDGHNVAVIGWPLWTQRFHANPDVLGHWFQISGKSFQIVGVAQKGFNSLFRGFRTDLWLTRPNRDSGLWIWEMVLGYARPRVAREQARQVLQAALTNFRRDHPSEFRLMAQPGQTFQQFVNQRLELRSPNARTTSLQTDWERPLWTVAMIAGLVLLVACSNVANLLVARAVAREREMALRISIGACRVRLIQQLLIESSIIASAACCLGLAFAYVAAPAIARLMLPSGVHVYLENVHVDLRVLPCLAFIGVVVTLLFGLAPALRASAVFPLEALKRGGSTQSARISMLRPLLAAQVGFCFAVLFVGALLLGSFEKLTHVKLGFSKTGVLLAEIGGDVPDGDKAHLSNLHLLESIRALPGVVAASMSEQEIVDARLASCSIRFLDHGPETLTAKYLGVSPGFFDTMQIRLLEGRDFTPRDETPESVAVIVNQAFVRQYSPHENPLGRRFEKIGGDGHAVQQRIIGVAQDAKYGGLREPNAPTVHEPLHGVDATLEVRVVGNSGAIEPAIRQAIRRFHAGLRASDVMLQSTRIDNGLIPERLLGLLSSFFGSVALILAGIGLYGVISYSVLRRTKEIGLRFALGARHFAVVWLVLSDTMRVVAVGLAFGITGGLVFGRFVSALLFEVKPYSFLGLALPSVCFLVVSALAAAAPTFRATHVDPITALRDE